MFMEGYKINLTVIGGGGGLLIDLDEGGDQWRASCNTVMNLSQNSLNFLSND